VDGNPDSPWNPRVPADISPTEFEKLVLEWLRRAAGRQKQTIEAQHLGVAQGDGGEYKIDVLVTFHAFQGALFLVLVECKHQRRPVEREDVMVLESKMRDVHAQKGLLFSTSGFQSGALVFAATKRIGTVAVVEGEWLYETSAAGSRPIKPPPWAHSDRYKGIRMTTRPDGGNILCHTIELACVDAIDEWLTDKP
jgi:restriction system protein